MKKGELWDKTKTEGMEWDIFNEVLEVVFEEEKKDNEELSAEDLKKLYEATDFNEGSGYDTVECICHGYVYYSDLLEWFTKDLGHMHYVNLLLNYAGEICRILGACESGSFDIWKLLAWAQEQYYIEQVDTLNMTLRDMFKVSEQKRREQK